MVVDDHPMWREGVSRDLAAAGYDVVAATGEGRQAVRIAAAARPDVVVLDLQLPDISGVEVISGLVAELPGVRVLMLSASGEQQDVLDAMKAGAGRAGARRVPAAGGRGTGRPRGGGAEAHRAGDRGAAPGGEGIVLPPDRRAARAQPPHGAEPRPEHPRQAPAAQPRRAHPLR